MWSNNDNDDKTGLVLLLGPFVEECVLLSSFWFFFLSLR